jgi:hypothetical protein
MMAGYRNKQIGLMVVGVLGLLLVAVLVVQGGLLAAPGRDEAVVATREAAILTEEARPATQVATPAETPAGILTRAAATPAGAAVFEPIPGGIAAGSGYMVEVAPPFSGSEYQIVNSWYQDVDGGQRRIFVFAGAMAGPGGEMTEQGVVIVQVWQMGGSEGVTGVETIESNSYLTEEAAGALRIVGAEGSRLTLETPDGRLFQFDVNSRQLTE